MTHEIVCYSSLCELSDFTINGIDADYRDFGTKSDRDSAHAEEYGCGNMRFEAIPATNEILTKYGISVDEYNQIAAELCEELSFGCCEWCV